MHSFAEFRQRVGKESTMDDRVATAISHWAPRFTMHGVTAGDFERITSGLRSWDD